ncbi:hypothetical protein WAF17_19495 [Bernardetia sp. ABR2-2B]|uniref:hypothetical protein n=1 Tax=Bernardetia sp. ABR2-2B TaxID=3127472 RepID=UPI0030D21C5E
MKKRTINKSTLLLAFLAVAFWCFYFWQENENEKFIEETQNLAIEASDIKSGVIYYDNLSFLEEVKRSFIDSARHSVKHSNFDPKEKLYYSIPKNYQLYLEAVNDFEREASLHHIKNSKYLFNKHTKQDYINTIKSHLEGLQNQSAPFATIPKVNWEEKDNFKIWLDLYKQRKEIIQIADSIFTANKKQFPTSYSSNHFEGYSTLIPNYENQKMTIKVFYFQSDTQYRTEYQKERIDENNPYNQSFTFEDSVYFTLEKSKTYHVLSSLGDTTLRPKFLFDDGQFHYSKTSEYDIDFKIIPKK